MLTIVIPMAGAGTRFAQAGYQKPKPFIDVGGKPMIVRVLENLAYPNARYVLVARKEQLESEPFLVQQIERNFNVIFLQLDRLTEGTVCTVLFARRQFKDEHPLLIANCDQIVDIDIRDFINDCQERELDGSMLTFVNEAGDPKWSYARLGSDNLVCEVREKAAISVYATVGIYFYTRSRDFVDAALDMWIAGDRVNNEYYTCPTYNHAIRSGLRIGIHNIPTSAMHGLGTPEDLNTFTSQINQ